MQEEANDIATKIEATKTAHTTTLEERITSDPRYPTFSQLFTELKTYRKNHYLAVTTKQPRQLAMLKKNLKHFGIVYQYQKILKNKEDTKDDKKPSRIFIQTPTCSLEAFINACQKTINDIQKAREEIKRKLAASLKKADQIESITPSVKPPTPTPAYLSPAKETQHHVTEEKKDEPRPPKRKRRQQRSNTWSPNHFQPAPATIKNHPTTYQWPCGLRYSSEDDNNGFVKQMTNNYMPDELYFGFIPEEALSGLDDNTKKRFYDQLIKGIIGNKCI